MIPVEVFKFLFIDRQSGVKSETTDTEGMSKLRFAVKLNLFGIIVPDAQEMD